MLGVNCLLVTLRIFTLFVWFSQPPPRQASLISPLSQMRKSRLNMGGRVGLRSRSCKGLPVAYCTPKDYGRELVGCIYRVTGRGAPRATHTGHHSSAHLPASYAGPGTNSFITFTRVLGQRPLLCGLGKRQSGWCHLRAMRVLRLGWHWGHFPKTHSG